MPSYRGGEFTFEPSSYQKAIVDAVLDARDNIFVEACAGSGKSTTLEMLAQYIRSGRRTAIAFNNAIVDELKGRLMPYSMPVTTNHSLGLSWLRMVRPSTRVDKDKYKNILAELCENNFAFETIPQHRRTKFVPQYQVLRLFELWLLTCSEASEAPDLGRAHELEISMDYDAWLPLVMEEMWRKGVAMTLRSRGTPTVGFVDMVVAPVRAGVIDEALNVSSDPRYDVILGDECQDWSASHIRLVEKSLRPTGRLIVVGDPKQAIYGFAGAMSGSTDALADLFGCVRYPLPTSYRCPTSHVALARQLVPAIQARPGAPVGVVGSMDEIEMRPLLRAGDLVVCRYTAPLLKTCFALISRGVKSSIRGKDMGNTLYSMATRAMECEGGNFLEKLGVYKIEQTQWLVDRASSKRLAMLLELMEDRFDCLEDIWRRYYVAGLPELRKVLNELFTTDGSNICLSSVHRAKGLEAERVFFLHHERVPHSEAEGWQLQEELNIRYVALTRSKSELYLVTKFEKAKSVDPLAHEGAYSGEEARDAAAGASLLAFADDLARKNIARRTANKTLGEFAQEEEMRAVMATEEVFGMLPTTGGPSYKEFVDPFGASIPRKKLRRPA